MDSLANYESDESAGDIYQENNGAMSGNMDKMDRHGGEQDANYDNVHMDMSEESNNNQTSDISECSSSSSSSGSARKPGSVEQRPGKKDGGSRSESSHRQPEKRSHNSERKHGDKDKWKESIRSRSKDRQSSRSSDHKGRSRSPNRKQRSKSPGRKRRSRSPDRKGRGLGKHSRSPDRKRPSKSPGGKGRSRSPNHRRRSKSPGHKGRSGSPDRKGRSGSPDRKGRSRSPDRKARTGSRDRKNRSRSGERKGPPRSPKKRSKSPDHKVRSKSPDRKLRSKSPERAKGHSRSPGKDSRKKRSSSKDRVPTSSSARRRSRSRSRSRSRERMHYRGRYEKKPSKLSILERLGIEIKAPPPLPVMTPQQLLQKSMELQVQQVKSATGIELPSYYNPTAMNPARYANQIQKRRLLWGSKLGSTEAAKPEEATTAPPQPSINQWEGTTFARDQDGKMTAKFKRLMGIKEDAGPQAAGAPSAPEGTPDIIRKQEEMFSSMEMQYEVARVATHTHRGVGLGFGTFQYPR